MAQTRVSDDHKSKPPTAAEQREIDAEQDELLADMPALRPAHQLRMRQRSKVLRIALKFMPLLGEDNSFEIETTDPRLADLVDILADVDDFAESIAEDAEAYRTWAFGASIEQFTAILLRYASAVGE